MELSEAIASANGFIRQIFPNTRLSVEEVDYDDISGNWLITFGYKRELPPKKLPELGQASAVSALSAFADRMRPVDYEDVYKVVSVPTDGGRLTMKNRKA